MVEMNEQVYINGNTVMVPKRRPEIKENEKAKQSKERNKRNKKNRELKSKIKTLVMIVAIFIGGFVLINRYATIYNMQGELSKKNAAISDMIKVNDDLNLTILKSGNINNMDNVATNKLKMVKVDASAAVSCDLQKDNFKKTTEKSNAGNTSVFEKIKKMLF